MTSHVQNGYFTQRCIYTVRLCIINTILFYKFKDDEKIQTIVKDAIDVGYRHFDTSPVYRSEPSIGLAIQDKIAEGTITRDDVFLVSKVNDGDERVDGACVVQQ